MKIRDQIDDDLSSRRAAELVCEIERWQTDNPQNLLPRDIAHAAEAVGDGESPTEHLIAQIDAYEKGADRAGTWLPQPIREANRRLKDRQTEPDSPTHQEKGTTP
ncbi:MAG TPA: hypothetical protein VMF31_10720 [Solirubrobacterales bacterium]|nr:hypothetical protein [Solirubrobacterales bacterium]